MANLYKYGLSNVYYAVATETVDETTGEIKTSYGTPKAWDGAVSLTLSAEGSSENYYTDNGVRAVINSNNGYTGDFECSIIPDDVLISILGQHKDETTGLIYETGDDKGTEFALMFQFEGDANAIRHVYYRCKLTTRPNVEGETKGENVEPKNDSVSLTCMQRKDADHLTKGFLRQGDKGYDNFFKAVLTPTAKAEG